MSMIDDIDITMTNKQDDISMKNRDSTGFSDDIMGTQPLKMRTSNQGIGFVEKIDRWNHVMKPRYRGVLHFFSSSENVKRPDGLSFGFISHHHRCYLHFKRCRSSRKVTNTCIVNAKNIVSSLHMLVVASSFFGCTRFQFVRSVRPKSNAKMWCIDIPLSVVKPHLLPLCLMLKCKSLVRFAKIRWVSGKPKAWQTSIGLYSPAEPWHGIRMNHAQPRHHLRWRRSLQFVRKYKNINMFFPVLFPSKTIPDSAPPVPGRKFRK